MWLAHCFPGLALRPEELWRMTPEQRVALEKAGHEALKPEAEERFAMFKGLMTAAGARLF